MKRITSLLLAVLMVATLASCGGNEDTPNNTGSSSGSNSSQNSSAASSDNNSTPAESSGASESTEGEGNNEPTIPSVVNDTKILVSPTATYKYRVFSCPYTAGGPGGEYTAETDTMADYMSSFGWNFGDATLPEDVLNDIKAYENEAQGPFGDAAGISNYYDENDNTLANNAEIGWTGDNHGLILYTTFTIDNLEEFKSQYEELLFFFWYDNTPSVYLNGDLVMYYNTELTGNPGDWVDSFDIVDPGHVAFEPLGDGTLMDHLVEGENTIVIVLKDAWGGRECCFEVDAE